MSTSTLEYALAEASQWLHRLKVLHGIDLTAQAHRKTVHEAVELADDPSLEEWADVAICLMGVALAQGWHFGELADAIHAKVAINAAREWRKQHDGTYQHTAPEDSRVVLPGEEGYEDAFDVCPEPTCPLYGKAVMADHWHLSGGSTPNPPEATDGNASSSSGDVR